MPKGGDLVLKNLNAAIRGIKGRTHTGVRLAANVIVAESKRRVPVDTGYLKGSHYIEMLSNRNGMPIAEIGCTAEYAIYVHENLEANHPHGKAKYLEDPMNRQVVGIAGRIADKVERATKGMLR